MGSSETGEPHCSHVPEGGGGSCLGARLPGHVGLALLSGVVMR